MKSPVHSSRLRGEATAPDFEGDCAIATMAKFPRAGFSKTRLCPPLEPEQAARLSAAFIRDTTETVCAAVALASVVGYAAYAPAGSEQALGPLVAPGTTPILADGLVPVPAGVEGFGRCLLHAIEALFARGHAAACVLSSDTPTLPISVIVLAATLLLSGNERRVVIGTCDDGGYYFLGMRRPHAGLFANIGWSTDSVAAATRARATMLGLDLVELPPWYDIDDAPALERLVRETTQNQAAPWTRLCLQALGLAALHPSCAV